MLCKTSSKTGTSKITKYCACRKCDLSFSDLSDACETSSKSRTSCLATHCARHKKNVISDYFVSLSFLVLLSFLFFYFLSSDFLLFSLPYFSDLYFPGPAFFSLLYLFFPVILKLQNSEVSQLNFRWIKWCIYYIYINMYIYIYI